MLIKENISSAVFSDDKSYRYVLFRKWSSDFPVTWIMLNPSTAGADCNDRTIERVIWFSRYHGFGCATIINLFALRSTDPTNLAKAKDPVGPENDKILQDAINDHNHIICAWGSFPQYQYRIDEVLAMMKGTQYRKLACLGLTKQGFPRHPLYLPSSTNLQEYNPDNPDPSAFRHYRKKST